MSNFGNRDDRPRPPYRGNKPSSQRFSNSGKKPTRSRPSRVIPNAYPTRAMVRDARSKRIEKHVIDILRTSMKTEQFERLMFMAKQRVAKEMAKELGDINIKPDS